MVDANVGPDRPLPIDESIQVSFDRFLNPLTVSRQSIALRDEFNQAPVNPTVTYDPVRRVATLSNPSPDGKPWLTASLPYKIIVSRTVTADDLSLRTLEGGGVEKTVIIGFFATAARGRPAAPATSFCRDVLPVLQGACGSCHGDDPKKAWAGLRLASPDGVKDTAIGKVAIETAVSGRAVPSPPGPKFGQNVPIVDPGNPGNSYLLYKLLLGSAANATPRTACGGAPIVVPKWDVATLPRDWEDERSRLADVIPGRGMPLAGGVAEEELDRIRQWIAEGATVDACSCR